jgi:hypothetical protein
MVWPRKWQARGDNLCSNGVPEPAALSRSYGLAALKESMRLHPPAPILYREVERAFELGGYEFAPDVAVWVSPQLLHLDARYFPEPHRFCPERFLSEGLTGASGDLSPFRRRSAGVYCHNYALHQMTLIVFSSRAASGREVSGLTRSIAEFILDNDPIKIETLTYLLAPQRLLKERDPCQHMS